MPDAFSKANLLNEYIRGFDAGACCSAGIMLAFFYRSIPAKTAIAASLIYIFLLAIAIGTFLADYLLTTNCYLRVKLINTFVLLNNVAFWVFQADLTHTVTAGISASVPGAPYIIIVGLLFQCSEACYILYCYEAKMDPNGVCQLTLDPKLFMLDKVSEVAFSLVVAVLFLYPLFLGARELEGLAPSNQHKDVQKDSIVTRQAQSRPNTNAGYLQPWVAAKLRLIKVMRHRGFILVLSVLAKVIHIVCVLTSENPTILTTWNAFFVSENTLLMAVHICSTLEPSTAKLNAVVTSTRKSMSHSLAQTSKSSALSIPVDDFAVPCAGSRPISHVAVSPGVGASLPRRFDGDRHAAFDVLKA
ncbi:hypothetical protein HDU80_002572 [Chytriomyces hyalinus]|nr:hypothetical protein HDU80_002572 [Chytriomyces hyalinus]